MTIQKTLDSDIAQEYWSDQNQSKHCPQAVQLDYRMSSERPISITAPEKDVVFQRIISFITDQILAGKLRAGDRLLPERELAEALHVSRPSLREALRALSILSLIDIRRGSGAYIMAPQPDGLATFFGVSLSLHPEFMGDLKQVRVALECQAVRLACEHVTAADLRAIDEALGRMNTDGHPGTAEASAQADFDFHTRIVEASQNSGLAFLYNSISVLLRAHHGQQRRAVFTVPSVLPDLQNAHEKIVEMLRAGDPDGADAAMRAHFELLDRHYAESSPGDDQSKHQQERAGV